MNELKNHANVIQTYEPSTIYNVNEPELRGQEVAVTTTEATEQPTQVHDKDNGVQFYKSYLQANEKKS